MWQVLLKTICPTKLNRKTRIIKGKANVCTKIPHCLNTVNVLFLEPLLLVMTDSVVKLAGSMDAFVCTSVSFQLGYLAS